MIIQALADYYVRKCDNEAESTDSQPLSPEGFEYKEIPFLVIIDKSGKFIQFEDTREGEGKKKRAKSFLVPKALKKTSGVAANLLWDNAEYVFGACDEKKLTEKMSEKNKTRDEIFHRINQQHSTFKERIQSEFRGVEDDGIKAINTFMETLNLDELELNELWLEITESNPNLTFKLAGDTCAICERDKVKKALSVNEGRICNTNDFCFVTGVQDSIERLHASIKGVAGAQTSGANIVSFNKDAFKSFGKNQGFNSPIGQKTAFAYTTALNHLLSKDSKQKKIVGDTTMVFWAKKSHLLETGLPDIFGEPPKDDPDRNAKFIKSLYEAPASGAASTAFATDEDETGFFILGLSPNASRISVRFWIGSTIAETARNIRSHFDDIKLVHGPKDPEYLSIFRLLVSTAQQGKSENIPPNLAGETMRAALTGRKYPKTLLLAAVNRARIEKRVNYPRAALIKACLNRQARQDSISKEEELTVALDDKNINIGYRLGRLFAVLEKIQAEANPGINATIRDRYYGAASGTPVTVFPILMRLKNHHLSKLDNRGRAVNLEKLISSIVNEISDFPAHLGLDDQGRFAVGYYHQQNDFYKKHSEE